MTLARGANRFEVRRYFLKILRLIQERSESLVVEVSLVVRETSASGFLAPLTISQNLLNEVSFAVVGGAAIADIRNSKTLRRSSRSCSVKEIVRDPTSDRESV